MRSLPNKLYSFRQSILYHMLVIMRIIPDYGISQERLYSQVLGDMTTDDFLSAMTYLFAIDHIYIKDGFVYHA